MSAAAVAAGAMAVESQNIVGTQDFNGTGGFTLAAPGFLPVGTDGSGMTLGDLMANADFVSGSDAISLYNGGNFVKDVTFYPYDDPDGYGIAGGWYEIDDFNDSDDPTLLNDTPVPFGTGFAFSRSTSTAAITFVGEVKDSATTLPSTGGFTLCGNASPVDMTLANFSGNADFVSGSDAISLYNGGNFDKDVTFYPYDDPDGYGIAGGWYEIDDFNDSDDPVLLNSTSIPAGRGFAFSRSTATARIIVANPMTVAASAQN